MQSSRIFEAARAGRLRLETKRIARGRSILELRGDIFSRAGSKEAFVFMVEGM